MGVLYEHWDPIINECFYVGASWTDEDLRPYDFSPRNKLGNYDKRVEQIRSLGKEPEVRLIECSHLSDEELDELEILQIAYWKDLIGDRLTNVAKGGRTGWGFAWSEEMCLAHSATMTEYYQTEKGLATRQKLSEKATAQAESEGFAALSARRKKFYESPEGKECAKLIGERKRAFNQTKEGKSSLEKAGKKISEALKTSDKFWDRVQKQKESYNSTEGQKKKEEFIALMSKCNKGSGNPNSNISEELAQSILDFVGPHAEAARKHGVSYATAYFIRKRTSWKHLTPSKATGISQ